MPEEKRLPADQSHPGHPADSDAMQRENLTSEQWQNSFSWGEQAPSQERIFTFYSYKGGVGRSLALYNVGCMLAEQGRQVLLIDADLEAPGLSEGLELETDNPPAAGFLELATESANALLNAKGLFEENGNYLDEFVEKMSECTTPVAFEREGRTAELRERLCEAFGNRLMLPQGRVDLISVGRIYDNYAQAVARLPLKRLFSTAPDSGHINFMSACGLDDVAKEAENVGQLFVELFRQALFNLRQKFNYDYVLIDSRTGLADVAGLCVRGLPDRLVILFGLNEQNIRGTKRIRDTISESESGDGERVIYVASPLPNAEAEKVWQRLKHAARELDVSVEDIAGLHYYPRLALEEMNFGRPFHLARIAEDYEKLTGRIRRTCGDMATDILSRTVEGRETDEPLSQESLRELGLAAFSDPDEVEKTIRGHLGLANQKKASLFRRDLHQLLVALKPENGSYWAQWGLELGLLGDDAISRIDEAQGLYAKSVEKFERALKVGAADANVMANLATALVKLAELKTSDAPEEARHLLEKSFDHYERALELEPTNSNVATNWGNALRISARMEAQHDLQKCRELYGKAFKKHDLALALNDSNADAAVNWGNSLQEFAELEKQHDLEYARKLYEKSFVKYKKALALDGKNIRAAYNWGTALARLAAMTEGDDLDDVLNLYEEACHRFQEALKMDPERADIAGTWGQVLTHRARLEIDRCPGIAKNLYHKASKQFERVLELQPDSFEAAYNCAAVLLSASQLEEEGGESEEAESMLKKAEQKLVQAERLQPGAAAYNWACLYARRGETDKALEKLEQCLPGDASLQEHAKEDSDLKSLWQDDRFKQLVEID